MWINFLLTCLHIDQVGFLPSLCYHHHSWIFWCALYPETQHSIKNKIKSTMGLRFSVCIICLCAYHIIIIIHYIHVWVRACVCVCVCVCVCERERERERERDTHTHTHTHSDRERSLSHLSIKQTGQITCHEYNRSGPTTTTNEQKYKLENSTLHTACVWIFIYAILWKAGYKATVEPSTLNEVSHTTDEEEGSYWCLILLSW